MDHLRILRDIELRNYKPVYFLMGEEAYFIDLISGAIEEKVLDEAARSFSQTIVYGRDVTMDQIASLAKGFPMMGDRQVVIVKEAQEMKEFKSRKKDDDDDDMKRILAYLQSPTPSTLLVFTYKHKTLDKRKKIYKSIDKIGVVMDSPKIKDNKLADWIEKYVAQRGFKINPNAAGLLAEYLGTDLSKVVNAVNKLAIILPEKGEITPKTIEDNIGISKDYNVWELQKCLAQKDVLKSNRIIQYFEANPKANPIQMVLPSLYGYFSKLAMYISLPDKRAAPAELGINPYAINDYKLAAGKFSAQKVERIIQHLREADKKSKGINNYSMDHGEIMKELVFKILH